MKRESTSVNTASIANAPDLALSTNLTSGRPSYTAYVLVALSITSFFNYLDRSVFSVLAVPIKTELGLSDTQIGVLGGFGFALFYAILGLPLAWVADRHNRMTLLSICLAVWSAATAACGMAGNFVQMLLARTAVGAGEAGCVPSAYSVLSDYFPPRRRAFAVGMFHFGGNLGVLCGLMLAGILAEAIGWRMTFIVLGVPGILFAILLKLTVREPRRGQMDTGRAAAMPEGSISQESAVSTMTKIRKLSARPAYLHLTFAYTLSVCGYYASLLWLPQLFARVHGMSAAEIGIQYGLALGGGAVIGVAAGAMIATGFIARDRRWEMWFPAAATLASFPFLVGAVLAPNAAIAIASTFLGAFAFSTGMGPGLAAIQSLAEASLRATATAIILLLSAILGQGLGPTLVGLSSDLLTSSLNDMALSVSLIAVQITLFWSAIHFYLGGRGFSRDVVS